MDRGLCCGPGPATSSSAHIPILASVSHPQPEGPSQAVRSGSQLLSSKPGSLPRCHGIPGQCYWTGSFLPPFPSPALEKHKHPACQVMPLCSPVRHSGKAWYSDKLWVCVTPCWVLAAGLDQHLKTKRNTMSELTLENLYWVLPRQAKSTVVKHPGPVAKPAGFLLEQGLNMSLRGGQ